MSRKSKIDAVKKVEIVEKYLNGELSQKGAAKMCGVNKRSVQDWIRIYKTDGPESLLSPKTNKRYSKELKLQAVHAYLSGEGSLDEICVRFGIRQHPQCLTQFEYIRLTSAVSVQKFPLLRISSAKYNMSV